MQDLGLRASRPAEPPSIDVVSDLQHPPADRLRMPREVVLDIVAVNRLAAVKAKLAVDRDQTTQVPKIYRTDWDRRPPLQAPPQHPQVQADRSRHDGLQAPDDTQPDP